MTVREENTENIGDLIARHLAHCDNGTGTRLVELASASCGVSQAEVISGLVAKALHRNYLLIPKDTLAMTDDNASPTNLAAGGESLVSDGAHHLFISYRRADSQDAVNLIYDALVDSLGERSVFRDVEFMPLGRSIRDNIERIIASCEAVILVVGPSWMGGEPTGRRTRIWNENDYVRAEVEAAIKLGVRIIPLLIDGATLPDRARLPESVQPVCELPHYVVGPSSDSRACFEEISRVCSAISTKLSTQDGARSRTLRLPALDEDSLLAVRVLTTAAARLHDLCLAVMRRGADLWTLLSEDDEGENALVSSEKIVNEWLRFFGDGNDVSEETGGLPSSLDTIEETLTFCNDLIEKEGWESVQARFTRDMKLPAGEEVPNPNAMIASAITGGLQEQFAVIRKKTVPPRDVGYAIDVLERASRDLLDRHWRKVYITKRKGDRGLFDLRIERVLRRSLGNNAIFYEEAEMAEGDESIDKARERMAGCRALIMFVDTDFQRLGSSPDECERLQNELRVALNANMSVVPVLLPGVETHAGESYPRWVLDLFAFNIARVRPEPDFSQDIKRLLRFCRTVVNPSVGYCGVPFPLDLSHAAVLSLRTLANSSDCLQRFAIAIGTGDLTPADFSAEHADTVRRSILTVRIWCNYFKIEVASDRFMEKFDLPLMFLGPP